MRYLVMYAFVSYAFIFVHCIVFYSSGMEASIDNNNKIIFRRKIYIINFRLSYD